MLAYAHSWQRRGLAQWLLLILCAVWLAGCQAPAALRDGASKIATKGQAVCDQALGFYDELPKMADKVKHARDIANIIADPHPEAVDPKNSSDADSYADFIKDRKAAYKALKQVYTALGTLSAASYGDQLKQATDSVQTSYNSLKNVPGIPDDVKGIVNAATAVIGDQIQAEQIRTHNETLSKLIIKFQSAWTADKMAMTGKITNAYDDIATQMATLDSSKVNEQKLADVVGLPFSKPINVGIYIYQWKQQAVADKSALLGQYDDVGTGLAALSNAHGELAKPQPAVPLITYWLDTGMSVIPSKK